MAPLSVAWNAVNARHLLERATFSARPEEIQKAVALGLNKTVDALLAGTFATSSASVPAEPLIDWAAIDAAQAALKGQKGDSPSLRAARTHVQKLNRQAMTALQSWWLQRMAGGPDPLREKLTLFWHGHFATSADKVKTARLMWVQNAFLRQNALTDLHTLFLGIARDPAMIIYLDNETNRKQHANENFAREFMELFSMGIGHYTEDDVKQGGRAFTGWQYRGDQFYFNAKQHDYGIKTYLGQTGDFNGTDVVDIVMQQTATPLFMAGKLLNYYMVDTPDDATIARWGGVLKSNGFSVGAFLRELFTSPDFYQAQSMHTQIKSPVQLVAGTIHLLAPPWASAAQLPRLTAAMGQNIFYPPNVKGWDGGRTWINTATIAMRQQFADYASTGRLKVTTFPHGASPAQSKWLATLLKAAGSPTTAADAVDHLAGLIVGVPLQTQVRADLIARLGAPDAPVSVTHPVDAAKVLSLVDGLLKLPEYQLT